MSCEEAVFSNDYYDFILEFGGELKPFPNQECTIRLGAEYQAAYIRNEGLPELNVTNYTYTSIPRCFVQQSQLALEASGILTVQNQPALALKGQGILMGFVDTGIEYTSRVFKNSAGTSRILAIWDQTVQTGAAPEGFPYGSEYDQTRINEALQAENPLEIVPETDEDGHGTFIAAVAAGTPGESGEFTGAAPLASIAMVKLKPAKQYLKDFYFIPEGVIAYEETDIMAAVSYLDDLATKQNLALVICIGVGTNMGNHGNDGPLEDLLNQVSAKNRRVISVTAGNEAVERHHYYGSVTRDETTEYVEMNIDDGVDGFIAELWARAPELYSVSVISPTGEKLPPDPGKKNGRQEFTFLFENTTISIDYRTVGTATGNELIFIRFEKPVRGLWTLEVRADTILDGHYHIWLPVQDFLSGNVFFIKSNPDATITSPSGASNVLTSGAYDAKSGSLYLRSGRGYSFNGAVKPEIVAPGVDIYGPGKRGLYETRSGTSVAAAITAGAAALFMELSLKRNPGVEVNTAIVRNYFERGAGRSLERLYPDHAWGYGTLDLYGALESMRFL